MTVFKLNPSSPLSSTWVQCLYLSVCYFKARKYMQNKLTNTWWKQVDTVTLHGIKHFPGTLPKMETSSPNRYFPVLYLPSPCPYLLLSVLTLGHICVNSVCSFKITSSPIFLGIYNTVFCTVLSPCTQLCLSQQGAQERHAFKIRDTAWFLQGEAKPHKCDQTDLKKVNCLQQDK